MKILRRGKTLEVESVKPKEQVAATLKTTKRSTRRNNASVTSEAVKSGKAIAELAPEEIIIRPCCVKLLIMKDVSQIQFKTMRVATEDKAASSECRAVGRPQRTNPSKQPVRQKNVSTDEQKQPTKKVVKGIAKAVKVNAAETPNPTNEDQSTHESPVNNIEARPKRTVRSKIPPAEQKPVKPNKIKKVAAPLKNVNIVSAASTKFVQSIKQSNKPKEIVALKKSVKRLGYKSVAIKKPIENAQKDVEHSNNTDESSPSTSCKSASLQHRQPIYKSTHIANAPQAAYEFNDGSVYDYNSNSQVSQDDPTQNNNMKDVFEKLKRENKIVVVKKQARKKKPKEKKDVSEQIYKEATKKLVANRGIQALKEGLIESLEKIKSEIETVELSSESDDNDYIDPIMIEQKEEPLDISSESDESEHTGQIEKVQKFTHPIPLPVRLSKSSQKSLIYKMALSKPNYQSTPIRTVAPTSTKQSLDCSSPWRVVDDNVPASFYFSTSNDHLLTNASNVLAAYPNSIPRTISGNAVSTTNTIRSNASAHSNSSNKKSEKCLQYSGILSGDDETSYVENSDPVFLVDTINVSNIENCEPENHEEMQAKHSPMVTKIVLGNSNTGARIPLKSLAIKNLVIPSSRKLQQHVLKKPPSSTTVSMHNESLTILEDHNTPSCSYNKTSQLFNKKKSSPKKSTSSKKDADKYFGFEMDCDDTESPTNLSATFDLDLQHQLKSLRKFLPEPRAKPVAPTTIRNHAVPTAKTRNIFKDPSGQERIDEMLKSSAVASTSSSIIDIMPRLHRTSIDAFDVFLNSTNGAECSDMPVLFDTIIESESEHKKHRSYTRLPLRKRKLSVNYTSGEEEDDEENYDFNKAVDKKQRHKQYEKRKEQELAQAEQELEKFAEEFNSNCEQIDQYELQIEKSGMSHNI